MEREEKRHKGEEARQGERGGKREGHERRKGGKWEEMGKDTRGESNGEEEWSRRVSLSRLTVAPHLACQCSFVASPWTMTPSPAPSFPTSHHGVPHPP